MQTCCLQSPEPGWKIGDLQDHAVPSAAGQDFAAPGAIMTFSPITMLTSILGAMAPTAIVLHGTTSAGKSSIAKALQATAPVPAYSIHCENLRATPRAWDGP